LYVVICGYEKRIAYYPRSLVDSMDVSEDRLASVMWVLIILNPVCTACSLTLLQSSRKEQKWLLTTAGHAQLAVQSNSPAQRGVSPSTAVCFTRYSHLHLHARFARADVVSGIHDAVSGAGTPEGTGSQNVTGGSQVIRNHFPGDPWIYFCNGYFKVYLHLTL
jgi:hypothetical protein